MNWIVRESLHHTTFPRYFEQCRNDCTRSVWVGFHDYHRKDYELVVGHSIGVRCYIRH